VFTTSGTYPWSFVTQILFVIFRLVIVLFVRRFTASYYSFGFFKLLGHHNCLLKTDLTLASTALYPPLCRTWSIIVAYDWSKT